MDMNVNYDSDDSWLFQSDSDYYEQDNQINSMILQGKYFWLAKDSLLFVSQLCSQGLFSL